MSRGPGVIQRRIVAALQAEPGRWFTVMELAFVAYPDEGMVEKKHFVSVRRALSGMKVKRRRSGKRRTGGWHYQISYAE
jgi:hypothetical protein